MNEPPKLAPDPDDRVLTPGGYRPRQGVHRVGPDDAVQGNDAGAAGIVATGRYPNTEPTERNVTMSNNLVLTPGGYRDAALVHRVGAGHAIHVAEGRMQLLNLTTKAIVELPHATTQPGAVPGFGNGWIAYGYWINDTGKPVTSFRTTWRVPPAPINSDGQTIFLFNGIDPSNPSAAILQPVLQWGNSFAGGGDYWSVASWYVLGNGQAFFTPLVKVNEGDQVVGVMKLTGQGNGTFSYTSEFEGIAGTTLPVLNVAELVWLNETLEVYGITDCSDYPDTDYTGMRHIAIQTGDTTPEVTWTHVDQVTDCGQHVVVASDSATDGEVDLYYREPKSRFDLGHYAQFVYILFGVIHGEGGVAIVNGRLIRIPPRGPDSALFNEIAAGMDKVLRGFAVRDGARGRGSERADQAGLELMEKGLEEALAAVKKAASAPGNG